jgi:hypothetical protein
VKGEAGACIVKEPPVIPLPSQQIPNCNDVDPNVAQDCKTDSGQVCEAGTTEEGCELDGYHCTDEQGCGNYEDGICVDCPKDEELPVPLEDQNAFSPEVVEQIPPQEPLPPVPDETIFDESPPPPLLQEDPASLLPNNDAPEQEEEEEVEEEEEGDITTLDDEAESEEEEEGAAAEEEEVSDDDGDESEEDGGGDGDDGDDGGGDDGGDGGDGDGGGGGEEE